MWIKRFQSICTTIGQKRKWLFRSFESQILACSTLDGWKTLKLHHLQQIMLVLFEIYIRKLIIRIDSWFWSFNEGMNGITNAHIFAWRAYAIQNMCVSVFPFIGPYSDWRLKLELDSYSNKYAWSIARGMLNWAMLKFQIGIQACFTTVTYWSRFSNLKYRWKECHTDIILSKRKKYCYFAPSLYYGSSSG